MKIEGLGDFEMVPQVVIDLNEGNMCALDLAYQNGLNINENVVLHEYISEKPLTLALMMNNFDSVRWLVEHGANLNDKKSPSFLKAVRYCDESTIHYLVKNGADIHAVDRLNTLNP